MSIFIHSILNFLERPYGRAKCDNPSHFYAMVNRGATFLHSLCQIPIRFLRQTHTSRGAFEIDVPDTIPYWFAEMTVPVLVCFRTMSFSEASSTASAEAAAAAKKLNLEKATNFMKQYRDPHSRELKKLSANQFMDVWSHYDKDGKSQERHFTYYENVFKKSL